MTCTTFNRIVLQVTVCRKTCHLNPRYIILISRVFSLTPKSGVLTRKAADTNFLVSGLTEPSLKPIIPHILGMHDFLWFQELLDHLRWLSSIFYLPGYMKFDTSKKIQTHKQQRMDLTHIRIIDVF